MRRLKGLLALQSTTDPQAVTIAFAKGSAHVTRGAAADAKVTIAANFATMSEPDAPKPQVSGALGHVMFAVGAAKALDPPKGSWQQEADRFWAYCQTKHGMPSGVEVVNTDDGSRRVLGTDPECELHGPGFELLNVFMGNTVLGEKVFTQKMFVVGPLRYLARLTGAGLDYSMGL